jgi:hypothetical protein
MGYESDPIAPTYPEGSINIRGNIPDAPTLGAYRPVEAMLGAAGEESIDEIVARLKTLPNKHFTLLNYVPKGKFQNGVGACNAYATGKDFQGCVRMSGGPKIDVSYAGLYWQINGGRDSGSTPEAALQAMLQGGIALADSTTPELTTRNLRLSSAKLAEAKQYRFHEAHTINRNDGGASFCRAIMSGFLCNGGIWWWDTDDYMTQDGRMPPVGRNIRSWSKGGHSVCMGGLKWFDEPATLKAGPHTFQLPAGLYVEINNHHGDDECPPFTFSNGATVKPRWGLNGNGFIHLGRFLDGMKAFGFWALRDVMRFWGDLPAPVFGEGQPVADAAELPELAALPPPVMADTVSVPVDPPEAEAVAATASTEEPEPEEKPKPVAHHKGHHGKGKKKH